jgi:hypothetical protein
MILFLQTVSKRPNGNPETLKTRKEEAQEGKRERCLYFFSLSSVKLISVHLA